MAIVDSDTPAASEQAVAAAAPPPPTATADAADAAAAAPTPKPQPQQQQPPIRRLEKRFQRHLSNHRRRPRELPADLQTGVVDWQCLLEQQEEEQKEDGDEASAAAAKKRRPYCGGDRAATAAALVALPTAAALARRPDLAEEQRGLWSGIGAATPITAYSVRGHPGLVVFPAAVPASAQLSLAASALAQWPEPPLGRTNLHAQYPGGLHGILQAAAVEAAEDQGSDANVTTTTTTAATALRRAAAALEAGRRAKAHAQQEADGRLSRGGFGGLRCAWKPQRGRPSHPRADDEDEDDEERGAYGGGGGSKKIGDNTTTNNNGRDQSSPAAFPAPHSPRPDANSRNPCTVCWEREVAPRSGTTVAGDDDDDADETAGVASTAAASGRAPALLRALRWATLGPPYDWTKRVYEPQTPHLPLPPELVGMARFFARLAAEALTVAAAAEEGGGDEAAQAAAIASAAAAASSSSATFNPDAALVNYYREGDTLFAHVDESEAGFDGKRGGTTEAEAARLPAPPPLVTVSVGAAALFLVGGPRRESEPVTPLLLRSGDVVVLAGPARRAHHGVPRVFGGERALVPGALLEEAAAAVGAEAAAAASAVFSAVRINISVRQAIERGRDGGGEGHETGGAE